MLETEDDFHNRMKVKAMATTEQPKTERDFITKPQNTDTRDQAVRTVALEMAIKANCGLFYNADNMQLVCDTQIVDAAKKFEAFIKGKEG